MKKNARRYEFIIFLTFVYSLSLVLEDEKFWKLLEEAMECVISNMLENIN